MKVDVTTVGSFQKQLVFLVPPEQVRGRLDEEYRTLSRRIRISGFRPGKVPRKVLESRFAPQVEAEVAQALMQTSYQTALSDHQIQPLGQANLTQSSSVADPTGFRFTPTVDVRPEITLTRWTGMDVVYPTVEVTSDEVDRTVKARLEGHAKLEEVSGRAVQSGDMAMVELVVRDDQTEVANEPGTMIRTAGDPYYPGVEALLIGLQAAEEKEGKVRFAESARTAAVAGRELDVKVKILSIQSYRVPELTDELSAELGFEGGTGGMRTSIEGQIRQGRDEMARNQARANLLEVVIGENPFDVPVGMIDQSLKMLMDELRLQQALRTGRDPRTIGFNEAQVADLRMRAQFAAKAALILEWVAKKEGIAVTEDDVEAMYRRLATERSQTVEAVKGWAQKENAAKELRERILEEKTLDWLLERANLIAPAPAGLTAPEPAGLTAPEPAEPAPPTEGSGSDDTLEGSVDALKEQLATGALDSQLDELVATEAGGRNRKGALAALEARKKEIGG